MAEKEGDYGEFHDQLTLAEVIPRAQAKGCTVSWPAANELYIDIDSFEAMLRHNALFGIFRRHEKCSRVCTPSPSGALGHYHVRIELDRDVNMAERLMLQAMLGSDPTRELLSYFRMTHGAEEEVVTLFFEKQVDCGGF